MARKKPLLKSPLFLIPVILLLILIVAVVFFRFYHKSEIEKRLAAIRAAGYPATCAELDAWYPDVPDDENAAFLILQAIDAFIVWEDKPVPAEQCETYYLEPYDPNEYEWALTMIGKDRDSHIPNFDMSLQFPPPPPTDWNIKNNKLLPLLGEAKLPDPPDHISNESLDVIKDFLADNTKALRLLHQAATLKHSRYPINLSTGVPMLTHLADVRIAAKVLCLEAIVYVEQNQSDQALQSIVSVICTANSLEKEPIQVSAHVKLSCESLAYKTINYFLNHIIYNIQQLKTLQMNLTEIDNQNTLVRSIASERAWCYDLFTNPIEFARNMELNTVVGTTMHLSGLIEVQHIVYLDFIDELILAAQMDYHQSYQKAFKLKKQIDEMPIYISMFRFIIPALTRSFIFHTRIHDQNLITRTAIAIEQFRLIHNRLPESLNQLIPDFLAEIPRDPFDPDNHPLRYHINETGYTVYSVGEDQVDHDRTEYDEEGNKYEEGTDITFTVYH